MQTSNYMITRSENDWNKDSDKYLGKLRANFVGTEFQVKPDPLFHPFNSFK